MLQWSRVWKDDAAAHRSAAHGFLQQRPETVAANLLHMIEYGVHLCQACITTALYVMSCGANIVITCSDKACNAL